MDIPSDIWRCIAGFLPVACIFTLYSVNRTFLEIYLEKKYKAVDLAAYKSAKALLKHLKDSSYVHSVRVQPWVVIAKEPKACSWKLLNACVFPTHAFEENTEAEILKRLRKQTQRIADGIKKLPALQKYHIDWDEGPFQPEFYSALLDVIPAIGRGLSTLCLKVPLQNMDSLPCLATHLPKLENLMLTIHTDAFIASEICQKIVGLVVFVNSGIRTLRSLSISTTPTSMYLDLGPFFDHLGRGKRLTSFTLCIPFDGGHLADPGPLRRFLMNHRATLRSITLGTMRAAAHPAPGASTAKFWIRDTFKNHPSLPALEQVSLSLRPLRTDLSPLVQGLASLRSQLRVLKLSERPLECAELVRLLGVLGDAPLLRVLSLRIRWLSPEVVDLLAVGLPALSALDLHFTEVVHQESASDVASVRSEDSYGLSRQSELMLFCQALQGKRYAHWNLTRLAVPENPHGQMRWLDAMERVFVGCIPGLTSFGELVSTV
ncbi:hypothetical protein DFH07DRAFT_390317 [Mycena maculata]|uniref:F-box domain-containing protein n=1 Tax=Mycena maculata TaxID=230809 RepID=A0AAD7KB08_9AGAR|nr:hypothetical protein DFH07DRAFT_390317 [Mycena maculata]